MARAINSFPVPVSPKMSTVASLAATVLAWDRTRLQRRAVSHDLFKVKFGTDLLLQVEFFAGQLVREIRDFAIGASIVQRNCHLRRRLLQKTNVLRAKALASRLARFRVPSSPLRVVSGMQHSD